MTWYEFLLFFHISMAAMDDLWLWVSVAGFALLAAVLVRSGLRARLAPASVTN
jgi:hypothetical protein